MTALKNARRVLPQDTHVLLDHLVQVLSALEQHTRDVYPFGSASGPINAYNKYVDFCISVYGDKLKQLYQALAHALDAEWYLVYAQCARSIIENTALLRYYSRMESLRQARICFESGQDCDAPVREALETVDRLARGTRFPWDAFVEKRFDELLKPTQQPQTKQVHINDCLRAWYKDKPDLEPLYNLLCDLVHPNLGSTLMVVRIGETSVVAGGSGGSYACSFIVVPTLAGTIGVFNEAVNSLRRLADLRLGRPTT